MAAYVIVDIEVFDQEKFAEYRLGAVDTIAAYGGRYLARGGHTETLEGDWAPTRLVILEFDSIERARQWLDSPEYAPYLAMRRAAARANMIVIEGYDPAIHT